MGAHSSTCKEAERAALIKLKKSFVSSSKELDTWVGDDCCRWEGVGCDNLTSNVVKLDLGGGHVYALEANEVSPALVELKYLTYLDLSWNDFNDSTFPEFIGSMKHLRSLDLSYSRLGGKVPQSLGNLTNLVYLDLRTGDLEKPLVLQSLGNLKQLKNLKYLGLSGISMSQTLDSLDIILNFPHLSVLKLAFCHLQDSHLAIRNSTISSSILQHLDLSFNFFNCPFPHFIQNLTSLTFPDLSWNFFSSSILTWLGTTGHLCRLEYLDLSYNQLQDEVSKSHLNFSSCSRDDLELFNYMDLSYNNLETLPPSLRGFCRLEYLDLSYNQLQDDVSNSHLNFSSCSKDDLELFKYLNLSQNNLETLPPSLGGLSSLVTLDLSYNNFTMFPSTRNMSFLKVLTMSHNNIYTLPLPLTGNLSYLLNLDLSHNNLENIPPFIPTLSSLEYLDLSSNPLSINVSSDWLPQFQLKTLHLQHSQMNTPFPKWLLTQKNISELDLSDTGIFGPLPNIIDIGMPSLSILRLDNNHINYSIPKSLCKLKSLSILHLQNNRLSGMIPDCWEEGSLIYNLDFSSNSLIGHIPNSLTKLNLDLLNLSNNSLQGELPLSLTKIPRLLVFDVGMNKLTGAIPTWSGADFLFMQILILRENRFNGHIPPQLASIKTLQIIDLACNNLDGIIPPQLGVGYSEFPLWFNDLSFGYHNQEWSAVEVIKGEDREYTTILQLLINMDLSSNNLVGVIPPHLTTSPFIVSLNLSNNHLSGTIPKEIGGMKALESLDLSHNNISGSIPQTISSLSFLSTMDLSFNNLQGPIPTSAQLGSLNVSSYFGNPGLCGDPLPNKCFGNVTAEPPTSTAFEDEDDKHEKMWLYLVIMLGFGIGFWGEIGTLAFKRRWRDAYFQLAEHLGDWIYVGVVVRIARAKGRN